MSEILIPDFTELVFDDEPHIYRLDGFEIPSVTTIMEPLSNAKYKGISDATLNNAAEKGTAVHNAIENYIKFGIDDVPPEHRGYFEAFLDWWNAEHPEVISSEVKIYHKILRYGGTIDLLVIIEGKLVLVDIKTTAALMDSTCGVQLEAYSQALKSHGIEIERKCILHLKKDGKYTVRDYKTNDPVRWKVFGALKSVYDYIKSSQ